MKINRTGSAVWMGGLKDGGGTISTQSGALKEHPYGFGSRFESGKGTNPEELIGAGHAGCFTMALSLILEKAGFKAERMETTSVITLEQVGDGFSITQAALTLRAKIPNIDIAKFQELSHTAEINCPVSKLFKTKITLDAQLL
jgi:osmotically inducible protein OsmC